MSQRENRVSRSLAIALISATIIAGAIAMPPPAAAWKPPTHLFATDLALQDLQDLKDGRVTIETIDGAKFEIAADPTIVEAVTTYPEAYQAGAVGPDAFPDILFGQSVIHTGDDAATSDQWLTHLWERAWAPARTTGDQLRDEIERRLRLQRIAFAVGFIGGHANGDVWAHTWINGLSGGVFPNLTELEDPEIAVRHIVIEGYVDKHRPGFDEKQGYEIDAPISFIADTFITSQFARKHQKAAPFFLYELLFDLEKRVDTFIKEASPPGGLIERAWLRYLKEWREDIKRGVRRWPAVWQEIARALLTGRELPPDELTGLHDYSQITTAIKKWATGDLLSMLGFPDFVGGLAGASSGVVDKITNKARGLLKTTLDRVSATGPTERKFVQSLLAAYKSKHELTKNIVDKVLGVFVTTAFGLKGVTRESHPDLFAALDLQWPKGILTPLEILNILVEPERYICSPLFPEPQPSEPTIRQKVDAAMGVTSDAAGCDTESEEISNGRLVFASDVTASSSSSPEIYTVNPDGSDLQQLTNDPDEGSNAGSSYQPAWSPDGTKIAFGSNRTINSRYVGNQLWVMNADGSGRKMLTDDQDVMTREGGIDWAPDGKRIAFVAGSSDGDEDIWVINADGSGARPVANDPRATETHPSWSPDGESIVYSLMNDSHSWWQVAEVSLASGVSTVLIQARVHAWQPDRNRAGVLAFVRDAHTEEINDPDVPDDPDCGASDQECDGDGNSLYTDLFLNNIQTRLAMTPELHESQPTFSPTGDEIAFITQNELVTGGQQAIWITGAKQGEEARPVVRMSFEFQEIFGVDWQATRSQKQWPDYDPQRFAPLRNTVTMAKLAFLNEDGLNELFRGMSEEDGALYSRHSAEAPGNVMLGWIGSLDGDYQWRSVSPYDGKDHNAGPLPLFSDCKARDRVWKQIFVPPATPDDFNDGTCPPSP